MHLALRLHYLQDQGEAWGKWTSKEVIWEAKVARLARQQHEEDVARGGEGGAHAVA